MAARLMAASPVANSRVSNSASASSSAESLEEEDFNSNSASSSSNNSSRVSNNSSRGSNNSSRGSNNSSRVSNNSSRSNGNNSSRVSNNSSRGSNNSSRGSNNSNTNSNANVSASSSANNGFEDVEEEVEIPAPIPPSLKAPAAPKEPSAKVAAQPSPKVAAQPSAKVLNALPAGKPKHLAAQQLVRDELKRRAEEAGLGPNVRAPVAIIAPLARLRQSNTGMYEKKMKEYINSVKAGAPLSAFANVGLAKDTLRKKRTKAQKEMTTGIPMAAATAPMMPLPAAANKSQDYEDLRRRMAVALGRNVPADFFQKYLAVASAPSIPAAPAPTPESFAFLCKPFATGSAATGGGTKRSSRRKTRRSRGSRKASRQSRRSRR